MNSIKQNIAWLKLLLPTNTEGRIVRLKSILSEFGDDNGIYMMIGNEYFKIGAYSEAIEFYKKSLSIMENPPLYISMSDCYRHLDDDNNAANCYEIALEKGIANKKFMAKEAYRIRMFFKSLERK